MRDSNPRGVAPNTLSNGAQHRPEQAATVRDLQFSAVAGRRGRCRTRMNETRIETKRGLACSYVASMGCNLALLAVGEDGCRT
jgi:hypothetical protein